MKKYIFLLLAPALLFVSCGKNNQGKNDKPIIDTTTKTPDTSHTTNVSGGGVFNADSAYAYVEKQLEFGPRIPNSKGHVACGDYLISYFKKYADDVLVQKASVTAYTGDVLKIRNIIARFDPKNTNRIALFAHWDTRPFADRYEETRDRPVPGADDGASGVAVLMELARLFKENKPSVGVDLILFDGEDYGNPEGVPETYCLGAQYWAKNNPVQGYKANYGILLDMVGAKGATFFKEGVSMKYASSIVDKVWSVANSSGYGGYFIMAPTDGITDDHYFVNTIAGIPTVDIINFDKGRGETGFGAHWHTPDDNISIIDKNTLKAVGQTLMNVIYTEQ